MAIKIVCDRCGKTIVEGTYYMIDIYAEDIHNLYGVSSFDASMNKIATNLLNIVGDKPCYCQQCINSIRNFIDNGSVQ